MCGIAGVYNPNGIDLNEVITLSETLRHRGPDDEGFFLSNLNEQAGTYRGKDTIAELQELKSISEVNFQATLGLVHRRLSILDVSALGHQPLLDSNNRYSLVFQHNRMTANTIFCL